MIPTVTSIKRQQMKYQVNNQEERFHLVAGLEVPKQQRAIPNPGPTETIINMC